MINKRRQTILELLERSEDWLTMKEIASTVDCSDKTVSSDLAIIKNWIPEDWKIDSQRGKGIKLTKPQYENSDLITSSKQSDQFQIDLFTNILTVPNYTLERVSDDFFMSLTSAFDQVVELENLLSSFDLKIGRQPLHIVGGEVNIRMAIYALEKEAFGDKRRYFNTYDDQVINQWTQLFWQMGLIIFPYTLSKYLHYVEVSIRRIKSGHAVSAHPHQDKIMGGSLFRRIYPLFRMLEDETEVRLSNDEKVMLYGALCYSEFYLMENIANSKNSFHLLNNNHEEYKDFFEFLIFLEEKMKIPLKDDPRFVTHCYDLFLKIQLRYAFPVFQLVGYRSSASILKEKFSLAYEKVNKICNAWTTNKKLPQVHTDSLASLTALLVSKVTENSLLKQRLLLLFSETYDIQMLNEATLHQYFGADSIIESKPYHFWNNRDIDTYDVIITDTPTINC